MDVFLQILGLLIACAILTQVILTLYASFRQQRTSLQLLRQRVENAQEAAKARRLEQERASRQTDLLWNGFRKFEIQQKVYEDQDGNICSFYLMPHDKKPLPPFKPGQFLTFQLNLRRQDEPRHPIKPIVRCYSLSDSPNSQNYYRITVKRMPPPPDKPDVPPGLVSSFFLDQLKEGDILDVKVPGGHFVLDTTQEMPVVLIGGGIGMTPLLSMLNAMVESGSRREAWFFYGVRNGREHLMKDHLERLAASHKNLHLYVCYSAPTDRDIQGKDYHGKGRMSIDLLKRLLPSNNYQFYVCGPPPMMATMIQGLKDWGVPNEDIKFEAFGSASVKKTTWQIAEAASVVTRDRTITFHRSGKTCQWDPHMGSLLEFAEANGVFIDAGCRVGNCNTCLTAIKEGKVRYLRDPDVMPEKGSCLTCISIPDDNLVLDA
jgi:hypothetical protein